MLLTRDVWAASWSRGTALLSIMEESQNLNSLNTVQIMASEDLSVSFRVQVISFFFLSPYFLAPFTDAWRNSCQYVGILALASATSSQGTPSGPPQ